MTTTTAESPSTGAGQVERKPLLTGPAILMMNLGFFGVQFSFGLTQSAVNPLFLLIGATPGLLPILNLAGPVTGLIIQPLIGAISDRTWSPRWGRRRSRGSPGGLGRRERVGAHPPATGRQRQRLRKVRARPEPTHER